MALDNVLNTSQSLYFAAVQSANAEQMRAKKKEEAKKVAKSPFAQALQKTHEEQELLAAGLPKEIAGMSTEDAVIFLKDAADIAAERLKMATLPENFAEYREKVSQFMRYIVKYNFQIKQHMRYRSNPKRRLKLNPHKQIVVINGKLDELARWMISSHRDTLIMLAKLEEINGLLVDLIAT